MKETLIGLGALLLMGGCNYRTESTGSAIGTSVAVELPADCEDIVNITFDAGGVLDEVLCRNRTGNYTLFVKEVSAKEWTARQYYR